MKQLISRRSFLKAAGVTTAVAAVSLGAPAASACYPGSFKDITILYTNDVHTYIDKKSPELTYAAIAALKKSYQDAGKNVLLVDAGDHIQGTAYGSMDEGASIIQLMNAAGYDVATPGNHEFDYGRTRLPSGRFPVPLQQLGQSAAGQQRSAGCQILHHRRPRDRICGHHHA